MKQLAQRAVAATQSARSDPIDLRSESLSTSVGPGQNPLARLQKAVVGKDHGEINTAMQEVVDKYAPLIRQIGLSQGIKSPALLDDLRQDIFLKLLQPKAIGSYDSAHKPEAWLGAVIVNTVRDYHRRMSTRKEGAISLDQARQTGPDSGERNFAELVVDRKELEPLDEIIALETAEVVRGTIARLPDSQKRVIEMRMDECSYAEMAVRANEHLPNGEPIALGTLKSRMNAAFGATRTALEPYYAEGRLRKRTTSAA
mgnify:CR=1 FL=1